MLLTVLKVTRLYSSGDQLIYFYFFKRPTEVILSRHLYIMVVTILWYKITTGTVTFGLRTDGDRLIPLQFRYPEHMESQFPDMFFVSVRYWSLMLLPQKVGI